MGTVDEYRVTGKVDEYGRPVVHGNPDQSRRCAGATAEAERKWGHGGASWPCNTPRYDANPVPSPHTGFWWIVQREPYAHQDRDLSVAVVFEAGPTLRAGEPWERAVCVGPMHGKFDSIARAVMMGFDEVLVGLDIERPVRRRIGRAWVVTDERDLTSGALLVSAEAMAKMNATRAVRPMPAHVDLTA